MFVDKVLDNSSRVLPECQMVHTVLLPLITLLITCRVLVQNKTCTVESPVEDDNEAAPTKEEDRKETAVLARAATTATESTQGREFLGIIPSVRAEGAVEVEVLRQSNTT